MSTKSNKTVRLSLPVSFAYLHIEVFVYSCLPFVFRYFYTVCFVLTYFKRRYVELCRSFGDQAATLSVVELKLLIMDSLQSLFGEVGWLVAIVVCYYF